MKTLFRFTLTAFLALLSSAAWQAAAQCGNDNTQFGTSTITCGAGSTVLTTCIYGGEYRLVNVTMGNTYTFSTCGDTDFDTQITLFNDAGGSYLAYNDDGCDAQSIVIWTATFTGAVRVLVDQYNCTSNTTCMTLNGSCTVPGSGSGCTTASYGLYPSSTYTPVCNGIAGTITSIGYAGEYSNVNVTSGTAYTFSSSIGTDYLTIAGSTGSPVYTTGTGSVTWTSTVTGTVRFYTHTNSACGESTSSRTRSVTCGSAPAYDPCASITNLTCGQSTTASSTGSGAWSVSACGFSTPGQEKVYSFTPTISGMHTLVITSTNSLYADYFYKTASGGCNASGWTCIDDLNSASSVTFGPLTAGTAYYILYDPESTSTTTHTFRIDCPVPPCNAPGTPSANSVGTTSATVSWAAAPGATSYDWTVGTGASCPTGTGANTAATSVNLTGLIPNTTYRFCVRTSACDGGSATSYVSTTFTTAPLPNDACSGAQVVTCGSTISGSTVGAASDSGVGTCAVGGGGTPGNGVWYKLVGNGAQVTASLCGSSYDTKLHVYTGTCGSLTCLTSSDDFCGTQSQVVFNANLGTDYYILVNGFGSATGSFSMSLTCLCGPAIGAPWTTTGVGGATGTAIDNVCENTLDVGSNGFSPSLSADKMNFIHQNLCGNQSVTVKVNSITNGGWAGIMFRESIAAGSKMVAIKTQLSTHVTREVRTTTNGPRSTQQVPAIGHTWLRLVRNGNIFTGYQSHNGVNWQSAFTVTVAMNNCLEVGLFTQGINVNSVATASFSNISGIPTTIIPLVGAGGVQLDIAPLEFSLFPNPTQSEINVKMGEEFMGKDVTVQIMNQLGQTVMVRRLNEVQNPVENIRLDNFAEGVYFLTLRTEGQEALTKKFIVKGLRP